MKLRFEHRYAGTPAQVVSLMGNREFIDEVARESGALEHSVNIDGQRTLLTMTLPAPPEARRIVGERVVVHQEFAFAAPDADQTSRGAITVTADGAPVRMNARGIIAPSPEGATGQYEGDLTVKVPLIGKRIESQIEPTIAEAFAAIERRANEWLGR